MGVPSWTLTLPYHMCPRPSEQISETSTVLPSLSQASTRYDAPAFHVTLDPNPWPHGPWSSRSTGVEGVHIETNEILKTLFHNQFIVGLQSVTVLRGATHLSFQIAGVRKGRTPTGCKDKKDKQQNKYLSFFKFRLNMNTHGSTPLWSEKWFDEDN